MIRALDQSALLAALALMLPSITAATFSLDTSMRRTGRWGARKTPPRSRIVHSFLAARGVFFRLSLVIILGILFFFSLPLLIFVGQTRPGRLLGWISLALAILLLSGLTLGLGSLHGVPEWLDYVTLAISAFIACTSLAKLLAEISRAAISEVGTTGLLSLHAGESPASMEGQILAVVLPESDLVQLGAAILTSIIPWMSWGEQRSFRQTLAAFYRDMASTQRQGSLDSATGLAVRELLGLGKIDGGGHYYAYVPQCIRPSTSTFASPAIVFLHGNGGNFTVFPWAWRDLAERRGLAVICPSFGYGFWSEGSVEAVGRVVADAVNRFRLDPDRLILSGLSDGGVGVTRIAAAYPERFRGLIYLSATLRPDDLAAEHFRAGWNGRPALVLQGGRDWSVTPQSVERGVSLMEAGNLAVAYRLYPEDDHFLFFARRREVLELIENWLCDQVF